jgi:hypothetical protein
VSRIAAFDNLDDRRELVRLLGALTPEGRARFVARVAGRSFYDAPARVSSASATAVDSYLLLCSLAAQRGLDLAKVGALLEREVKSAGRGGEAP